MQNLWVTKAHTILIPFQISHFKWSCTTCVTNKALYTYELSNVQFLNIFLELPSNVNYS